MEISEVGKLLALMATYDQRKVGETDVLAWSEIIGKLEYGDAKAAVTAFYTSQAERRIMPADIVIFVKNRIADRAARTEPGMSMAETIEGGIPDADPDDVPAYLAALREGRMRPYDDGTARQRPLRALLSRVFPLPPGGDE